MKKNPESMIEEKIFQEVAEAIRRDIDKEILIELMGLKHLLVNDVECINVGDLVSCDKHEIVGICIEKHEASEAFNEHVIVVIPNGVRYLFEKATHLNKLDAKIKNETRT